MQVIMPKLGLTMTHGTVIEWLKTPGDAVQAEEALCAYETEKVTLELTAPEDGVLVEILVSAGETVPAGAAVCEIRTSGEQPNVRDSGQPANETTQPTAASAADRGGQISVSAQAAESGGGIVATPKARALARELGIDLFAVTGSGPEGRVQAGDVQNASAAAQPAVVRVTPLARRIAASEGINLADLRGTGAEGAITREDVEQAVRDRKPAISDAPRATDHEPRTTHHAAQVIPHSTLRRTIADRMSQSAFSAPHVTLMTEAEATNLVSARSQLNEEVLAADKISYNSLLVALIARALREHPNLNARWEPDGVHLLEEINIALAVDTERGLMTPVLQGVDRLSLVEIQRGYTALAGRALAGKSLPDDFAGGTFTITNLGASDVDGFTPIINPPQAAILGVGRIIEKPVAREGVVVVRSMVTLSLSFDHRIVDGGPAAKFLQRVKQLVERPMALLLGGA